MDKITPKKSLGQNFLTNKIISEKIVDLLGNISHQKVIEIGPGMGVLTDILLNRDAHTTCIEIDSRAIEFLSKKYSTIDKKNFDIINIDFLKFDFASFAEQYPDKLFVIGNIPYNISTEIMFVLFENAKYIKKAVLTVQKEVAVRIAAGHGNKQYGVTTVARSMTSTAKIAFDISAGSFYPPPKITSSVLVFDFFDEQPEKAEFKAIMQLVKAAFSQRRKVLKNSLSTYLASRGINANNLEERFNENGIDYLKMRAEQLSLLDFQKMLNIINSMK